jgi:hypothetical protein
MSKKRALETGPIVYAGPTLPNNLLRQNTTFKDGIFPEHINELAKDEDFNFFLISPSKLGEMIVKLKNHSSLEYSRFTSLAHKLKGLK